MSVLRQDPTTRQWVILAPGRATRPHNNLSIPRPELPEFDESCPFCPGNEDKTPPEVLRVPDHPWRCRVVPNLYSALSGDDSTERRGSTMFREMPGAGSGEVVIESPTHNARLDEMPLDDVCCMVHSWRERYRVLAEAPHIRTVIVFKNFGPLAGTSLLHPHSQIVAIPVYAPRMMRRLDIATDYFTDTGHCVYDDLLQAERDAGLRIIADRKSFVAFEPFAAGSPYETWICPTRHQASLGEIRDDEIEDLAVVLRRVIGAIRRACDDPDYNLVVYSAPHNGHPEEVFLWHIKILPKLTSPAGFELGSGMGINTVAPEDSAKILRESMQD